MATQLGVFAKHWTPGRAKTRLAAHIGDESAAAVARTFLETLTVRLSGLADRQVIGFWPPEARGDFERLGVERWLPEVQREGDLGQRMRHYFESAFAAGADRVVLLGADSPDVPVELVTAAFEQLENRRLVLGPTDDGGYYLIGARGEPPPVFDGVPWSTEAVWQATVERLDQAGWREGVDWAPLPKWRDVDTITDMERLREDLQSATDPALLALRSTLDLLLGDAAF